jgi:lysophospholipase L1-like esterase
MMKRALMLIVAVAEVAAQSKVLQIGDSWGGYAGQTLATYCSGSTLVNKAVSSATASEWGAGSMCPASEPSSSCSATTAFAAIEGATHVVISVGGNDFLDFAGCSMDQATLTSKVTSAVNAVRAAAPSGIKIILVAYCTPTKAVGDCTIAEMPTLNAGIKAAADAAADVTFIDSHASCGGSNTAFSPGTHHVDSIHLNAKGYCEVWTIPAMQTALGCAAKTYDCASVAGTAVEGSENQAGGHAESKEEEETPVLGGETEAAETGGGGMGAGAYAGIAVGAIAALALVGFAAYKTFFAAATPGSKDIAGAQGGAQA